MRLLKLGSAAVLGGFVLSMAASTVALWLSSCPDPRQLLALIGAGHALGMVVAAGALWLIRKNALSDVEQICGHLIEIGEGTLAERRVPDATDWSALARQVNSMIARLRTQFDNRDARIAALRGEVEFDHLTGLSSRPYFLERLSLALHAEGDSRGAIAIVRIHDLAGLNLRVGRDQSDELISGVAAIMRVRFLVLKNEGAELARLNGADLAVLVPDVVVHEFEEWVRSLSEGFDRLHHEMLADSPHVAWIGATSFRPGESVSAVMARADSMLQSTESLRSGWRMADTGDGPQVPNVAQWRGLIEVALSTGRIGLVFREVLKHDGTLFHRQGEAQITLPDGSVFDASDLGAFACRVGRTVEVDLRAIELALEHIERAGVPVAVGISPESVRRPSFRTRLEGLLYSKRAFAADLWLEIREDILEDPPAMLTALARTASSCGAHVGIDRLHLHVARMSGLRTLGLEYVKLSPSVCHDMASNPASSRFVDVCLRIAQAEDLLLFANVLLAETQPAHSVALDPA
jgi:EAL domain-containing protein (putative c-di-GMP-specific phosphodiesterase class I)/GGDEF domain-containing protein